MGVPFRISSASGVARNSYSALTNSSLQINVLHKGWVKGLNRPIMIHFTNATIKITATQDNPYTIGKNKRAVPSPNRCEILIIESRTPVARRTKPAAGSVTLKISIAPLVSRSLRGGWNVLSCENELLFSRRGSRIGGE